MKSTKTVHACVLKDIILSTESVISALMVTTSISKPWSVSQSVELIACTRQADVTAILATILLAIDASNALMAQLMTQFLKNATTYVKLMKCTALQVACALMDFTKSMEYAQDALTRELTILTLKLAFVVPVLKMCMEHACQSVNREKLDSMATVCVQEDTTL